MPSLADYLVDFGKPAKSKRMLSDSHAFGLPQDELDHGALHDFPIDGADISFDAPEEPLFAEEPPDIDALVAEAVAKAEAELTERLEERFAANLAADRETHEEELERLRRETGERAGALIDEQLAAIEDRLTSYTSDVVARLLGPVLTASLQQKAVENLSGIIGEAIRESGAVRIRVRGPLSLFEALEGAVGEHSGRLEYTETDGFDLEVSIDESLYETRLSEWSQSLSESFL